MLLDDERLKTKRLPRLEAAFVISNALVEAAMSKRET